MGAKWYAVRVGRQGPKIYTTWAECEANVSRVPGASHKSFGSVDAAFEWIRPYLSQAVECEDIDNATTNSGTRGHIIDLTGDSDTENDPPLAKQVRTPLQGRIKVSRKTPDTLSDSDVEIVTTPAKTERKITAPNSRKKRKVTPEGEGMNGEHIHDSQNSSSSTSDSQSHRSSVPRDPAQSPLLITPGVVLSDEQREVLGMVKDGKNVFFTGSAGTGKSVLLREIINQLKGIRKVAITASTGIAGVNIGGQTLHSWAGVGLGEQPATKLVGKIRKNKRDIWERWKKVDVLIIDEISMIHGELFDKLEFMARELRRDHRPFGGIQLVLCGDFYQLPPVPKRDVKGLEIPPTFTFNALSWRECIDHCVTLTRVFRQRDQAFVDMLNALRLGTVNPGTVEAFRRLERTVKYDDGIEPTELYSTREEVNSANTTRLNAIKETFMLYTAADYPGLDVDGKPTTWDRMQTLLSNLVAPKAIKLKIGAQVMLIKNMIQGVLVNGSVGIVIDYLRTSTAEEQGYRVAIGDKKDGAGKEPPPKVPIDNEAKFPLVRFTNGETLLCVPQDFTVDNANGEMEAKRIQVPLILAWALSVHKSQGQTLERVKVDLKRTFEKGQAYVALSRATSMDTLEVLNFEPKKVLAHPTVIDWYQGPDAPTRLQF